jgi:hypothetical protein
MILAWLLLLTGLTISAVAIYYSVVGLAAIFSAAMIPIIIMGSALEVGKLVCASWLKANWERAPRLMKVYMTVAVIVLMLITSMGIFGFLSKAHSDQSLVSGDVMSRISIYDEKIKTSKENIDANRKALKQMDEAVDQSMARSADEKGADKAVAIRRGQAKERVRLQAEIASEQKNIAQLNEQAAPIRAEVRKVEAEVGPLKYIAAFVYGETDETVLEKAVTWVIITIIVVFDPLAVIMLLAAQMTFGWRKEEPKVNEPPEPEELVDEPIQTVAENEPKYELDDGPLTNEQLHQIAQAVKTVKPDLAEKIEQLADTHTEEVPSETPLTALGGDITATEEKPVDAIEDIPLDQWNKMIEEAEKAVAEEKATDLVGLEKELKIKSDALESERQRLRKMKQDFEQGNIAELPWQAVETFEEEKADEDSKKKKYMTKDQLGQIQVKDRT